MPVSYPGAIKTWADKQDNIDDVFAGDINGAYHEIIAVETELIQVGYKRSVRVATTLNGALATAFANGQTIDAIVLATGDRILIKDQTAGAENGIYTVNASGAPTRATDANADAHMVAGLMVYVREGAANAKGTWKLTTTGAITLGTTSLTFENEVAAHKADNVTQLALKVDKSNLIINAKYYGAIGNGIADDTIALQAAITAAITAGRNLYIPAGTYLISSTLTIDNSTSIFYQDNKKINIIGEGTQQTRINYTGAGIALNIIGGKTGTSNAAQSFQTFKDFTLWGTHALNTTGINVDACQGLNFVTIQVVNFDYGIYAQDIDNASFFKCVIHWNRRGISMREKSPRDALYSTRPNNINFYDCHIGNDEYGAAFFGGTNINFYGGSVQGNGINGIEATKYGILFYNPAVQGGVGCNINGVFFESNTNLTDIWIVTQTPVENGLLPTVYNITGCTFNRTQDTYISTHNILCSFDSANFGQQKLVCTGNNFRNFIGQYTPNVARPHIYFAADVRSKDNCYFYNNVQSVDAEAVAEDNYFLPIATSTAGAIGEFKQIQGAVSVALVLPAGGMWEWSGYWVTNASGSIFYFGANNAGVAAGGTTIMAAQTGYVATATVRRIS